MSEDFHDDPATLVSTRWLAAHLADANLRLFDASWYMPAMARDARGEYAAGHIPGARFFDIDALSDPGSPLPHMAPPPDLFAREIGALGVGEGDQIVVYDGAGLFSAARAWWTFRLMGVKSVAVLDGGLPKWRAEGRAITDQPAPAAKAAIFTARLDPQRVASMAQVARAGADGSAQIIDARPAARFAGEVPEPRPGLRSGHMPGSVSLPHGQLLNPDGTMKPLPALRAALAAAGVDLSRPLITSCGSGVTAAVLSLGLERLGQQGHALYDGSWAEWGQPGNHEVLKG